MAKQTSFNAAKSTGETVTWGVLGGLWGANMGVPLPGGTILNFASYLARKVASLKMV